MSEMRLRLLFPALIVTSTLWNVALVAWTGSVLATHGPSIGLGQSAKQTKTWSAASDDSVAMNDEAQPTLEIHLLSLKWSDENVGFSKAVRNVWRWKDSVLGDGRDFFVPKPKTLDRLNQVIIDCVPNIKECAVLSNCARFEILLVWEKEPTHDPDLLKQALSQAVSKQVCFHQSRPSNPFLEQLSRLDRPSMVDPKAKDFNEKAADEMVRYWTHLKGVESVCRHFCCVAAGMEERPNRPLRAVQFRPFSSRDAHVLLQLKRTAEVAKGAQVKTMLDAALSAGKAARDPSRVPLLQSLKGYGSDSKFSQEIPVDLAKAAAQAAMKLAVEPTVAKCVTKFQAISASETIARLRQQGEDLAQDSAELKVVRQWLHEPTLDLRDGHGSQVDVSKILADIKAKLQEARKEQLVKQ